MVIPKTGAIRLAARRANAVVEIIALHGNSEDMEWIAEDLIEHNNMSKYVKSDRNVIFRLFLCKNILKTFGWMADCIFSNNFFVIVAFLGYIGFKLRF